MSDTARQVQFTPWITNSGWTYWPMGRRVIAGSALTTLALSIPFGLFPLGLGISLVGLALILPALNRRQFTYQTIQEFWRNRLEARRERKRGPYRTRELREILWRDDEGNQSRRQTEPVQPNIIPLDGGKAGLLTEIHTPTSGYHTLFVTGGGMGSLVTGDPEDMVDLGDAVAGVLKGVERDLDQPVYGAMFFDRRPPNSQPIIDWYDGRAYLEADQGPQFTAVAENLRERLNFQLDTTGTPTSGIALCLPRPRAWNKVKELDKLKLKDVAGAPAYRGTDYLLSGLGGLGVADIHRPTPLETAVLIRGALDVTQIEEVYRDYHRDLARIRQGNLQSFGDSLLMQAGILPDDWSPMRSYLRIGDTFTRMFFVPEYPNREVLGGLMRTLFSAQEDLWYGISTVYQSMGTQGERFRNRIRRSTVDAKQASRAAKGASTTTAEAEAQASMQQADALLHYSGGQVIKMNLLSCVSSGSVEGLDEASALLRKMFRQVDLPLQPVVGRSLQIPVRLAMLGIRTETIQ